jgi:hypothetical protein
MKKLGLALLCVMCLAALPATLRADTLVDWTLSGNFTDGGTLSGTFTLDATTGVITAVNITTTAGSVLGGFNYTTSNTTATYYNTAFYQGLDFSSGTSPIWDLSIATNVLSAAGGSATIFTTQSNCPGAGIIGGCSNELLTTATLGANGCINDGSKNVRCLEAGALLTGTVEGGTTGGGGNTGGGSTGVPEPSTLVLCAVGIVGLLLKKTHS